MSHLYKIRDGFLYRLSSMAARVIKKDFEKSLGVEISCSDGVFV
jgi:hypothetical protein